MNNSLQSIKDRLKLYCKDKSIEFNLALRFYMYERFIYRLSKSKYRDNFILKGGFYLSTLFGLDNRSTMDIDTALKNSNLTEANILKMIDEIISIDGEDNVKFHIDSCERIRDEDEYGGLRVTLKFNFENVVDKFHIDVATGDPIYPKAQKFGYHSIIGNEKYSVWAYSIETSLAEKIETICSKLDTSSRMKDYYDIYLIYKNVYSELNKDNFKEAVKRTFAKRKFDKDLNQCLSLIRDNELLKTRWNAYARKNRYANDIKYEDTIECLEEFINLIIPVEV